MLIVTLVAAVVFLGSCVIAGGFFHRYREEETVGLVVGGCVAVGVGFVSGLMLSNLLLLVGAAATISDFLNEAGL